MGVVMVQSAGLDAGDEAVVSLTFGSVVGSKPALFALLAIVAMVLAQTRLVQRVAGWFLDSPWTGRSWWVLGGLVAVCLLPYAPGMGRNLNGAQRWIVIGGLSVQPSEIAKWGVVVMLARYGASLGGNAKSYTRGLLPGLLAAGIVAVIVAKEDLGTAVLIAVTAGVMLLGAGVGFWRMASLAPVAGFFVAVGVLVEPYRIQRLTTFFDPYADP